jgi:uncharacterized surface protein with fasciclin (FAS1) repeats
MKLSKLVVAAALAAVIPTLVLAQAPELAAQPEQAAPAAGPAATAIAPSGDIIATLTAAGQFKTLLKALDATNLTAVLKTPGPLTLFAPTDAAFAAMPVGQLDQLMSASPPAALQQLLVYHIVNAKVDSTKILGARGPIPTAAGKPVYVDGSASPAKANEAVIAQTNLVVSNGVIYPVDHVLSPSFTPPPSPVAEAAPAEDPAAAKAAAKPTVRKKK